MRVLSWNMACMPPRAGRFRTVEHQERQWARVADCEPDVALLQECRPINIGRLADDFDVVGELPG